MDLLVRNDIEDNIFSTTITIAAFGTGDLSEDQEKELLKDFPTKLVYRTLTFERKFKIVKESLEITDEGVSPTIVKVTLPTLSNKEIPIDENFEVTYKFDVNKVSPDSLDDQVINTKERAAEAYCRVFVDVICAEMKRIMETLRKKAPRKFTNERVVKV